MVLHHHRVVYHTTINIGNNTTNDNVTDNAITDALLLGWMDQLASTQYPRHPNWMWISRYPITWVTWPSELPKVSNVSTR